MSSEVCQAYWVWRELNRQVAANGMHRGEGHGYWNVVDAHVAKTSPHGWCAFPRGSLRLPVAVEENGKWRSDPAAPQDYDPYEEHVGRWFRTTNDSALSQYAAKDRYIQGTVHPTLNAHIAYAEAMLQALHPSRAGD